METKPMTEVERLRAEVEALKIIAVVLCGTAGPPELPALLKATLDGYDGLLLYGTKLTDQQREWMAKIVGVVQSGSGDPHTEPPGS
jgi:hypothetical protein